MSIKALLVGIEKYIDPANNLIGVSNDIAAITRMLRNFGYDSTNTTVLRDESATFDNMKAELLNLVKGANESDIRVFYFSGHGLTIPASATGGLPAEGLVPYDGSYSKIIMDQW